MSTRDRRHSRGGHHGINSQAVVDPPVDDRARSSNQMSSQSLDQRESQSSNQRGSEYQRGSPLSDQRVLSPIDDHVSPHITSNTSGTSTHASRTDSTCSVSRVGIYKKSSGGYDFTSSETSKAIRVGILARVNEFWPTFSSIPNPVQDVMFDDFQNRFRWRDDVSVAVMRKVWERKGSLKYREWVYNMKSSKKKPQCLPQKIFDQFLVYWDRSEVKELSQKNSERKRRNPKVHCGGSRATADYRNDIFDELHREPTSWEVYVRTHKLDSGDGSNNNGWVDHASAEFAEKYQAKIDELHNQGIEVTFDVEEEVFSALSVGRRDRRPNYGNAPTRYRDATYSISESGAQEKAMLKEELRQTKDDLHDLKSSFQVFKDLVLQRLNGEPNQL